jgi:iron complex outermembrane receptor protein
MVRSKCTRFVGLIVGGALAHGASAQEAQNLSSAQAAAAGVLQEIVVTATKRAENLQNVAESISAISGDSLEQLGAAQFTDYAGLVPGLSFFGGGVPGHDQIVLRGITSGAIAMSSTVGSYIDDVPFGTTGALALGAVLSPDPDLFDIDHIEVLKGPQGTLYGASTLGGLINIVTKSPSLDSFDATVRVDGDAVERGQTGYGTRGVVNIPLVDNQLAVRISAFYREDPGFIDNVGLHRSDVNSASNYGGRAVVLFKPTDTTAISLSALIQDSNAHGRSIELVDAHTLAPVYGDLTTKTFFPEPDDLQYRLFNSKITSKLGAADLTNMLSYGQIRDSGMIDNTAAFGFIIPSSNPGSPQTYVRNSDKISDELRVSSPTAPNDRIDWLGGLFYTHEKSLYGAHLGAYSLDTNEPLPVALYAFDLHLLYEEYAGFGDLTYHFTPAVDFTTGARWSTNRQSFDAPTSGLLSSVPVFLGKSSDQSWTFQEALRWRPTESVMTYLRAASGYRPGGPVVPPGAVASGFPTTFRPDTVWNYELGAKTTWLDHRLTADTAVYFIDWKDIQLNGLVGPFTILTNGSAAHSYGLEFETHYVPVTNLTVGFTGSYTHATLQADAPGSGGVAGDPLPFTPHWSGALVTDYLLPIGRDTTAKLGATVRYVGSFYSNFSGSTTNIRADVPSSEPIDLRAGIAHDRWDLMLRVSNLLDQRAFTGVQNRQLSPAQNLPSEATVIRPRTVSVTFSVRL